MSQNIPESLGSGVEVCGLYLPSDRQHEVWSCARLTNLSAGHKRAVPIVKRICLICITAGVRADGVVGRCG
jgi:hypothetical protein